MCKGTNLESQKKGCDGGEVIVIGRKSAVNFAKQEAGKKGERNRDGTGLEREGTKNKGKRRHVRIIAPRHISPEFRNRTGSRNARKEGRPERVKM